MMRYYTATVTFSITAANHALAAQAVEDAVKAYNAEQSKTPNGVGRNYVRVEEIAKLKEDK